jgi:hypothetical protein
MEGPLRTSDLILVTAQLRKESLIILQVENLLVQIFYPRGTILQTLQATG